MKKKKNCAELKPKMELILTHKKMRHIAGVFTLVLLLLFGGKNGIAGEETGGIKIIAAGDLMIGSWVEDVVRSEGWDYPFRNLQALLQDADIVFANLEAPFGNGGTAFEKAFTFRVSPDLVRILPAGRINMVSLANNHIMDYGDEVLRQTLTVLRENGVRCAGAGMNLNEARKPAKIQVKGTKVTLACYSLTFPEEFWASDTSAGTCFPYHTFFYDDIRKFKAESDLLVVSFHWGAELSRVPKKYQVDLAHRTIDAGADVIIGHHPHVVQGMEIYRGKLIAYSLGNFVFGSYSENVKESMLLELRYQPGQPVRYKVHPIRVYNKEVEFQPELLTGPDRERFMAELRRLSLELNRRQIVIGSDGWVQL